MRVVLDTNVLMSGIFFSGLPARIVAAWSEGRFELVSSVEVLAEYRRVGERLSKKFTMIDINPILDLVTRETRIVEPLPVPASACDDPTTSSSWHVRWPPVRTASSRVIGLSCEPLASMGSQS